MRLYPILLVVATLAGACGGSGSGSPRANSSAPSATASPTTQSQASPSAPTQASPSPAISPVPAEGGYGVLVSPSSVTYTVSLVGIDGRVVAGAQASNPAAVSCSNTAAALVPPPVSTSNTRAYFMDARGAVRTLFPDGHSSASPVINLPVGASRRSIFAVSPDDARMAVAVVDFTANGASTTLYVDQLRSGGSQVKTFSETDAYTLWPIGWHGPNLVVAKVPACTHGGGTFCCGPQELHVIDPATAARKFALGGPGCVIAGPPSPAGAVCETDVQANVMDWTGTTTRSFSIQGLTPVYLSPNGNQAAVEKGTQSNTVDTVVEGSHATFAGLQVCGWIDSARLLAGGDVQSQPRVADFETGMVVPVPALGGCAGRIPGGL